VVMNPATCRVFSSRKSRSAFKGNSRKAALFSCSVILLIVMCQAEVRHSRAERGHPNISAIGASPREWQQ
jgi:hypothetical protein